MFWTASHIFLWKQWKDLRFRMVEVICDIVFLIVFIFIRVHLSLPTNHTDTVPFTYNITNKNDFATPRGRLIYAPNTTFTYTLMNGVRNKNDITYDKLLPYSTVEQCYAALRQNQSLPDFAIVFEEPPGDTKPKQLKYVVYTLSDSFNTNQTYVDDIFQASIRDDEYINSGFLAIQDAIDGTYMDLVASGVSKAIEFHKFPSTVRIAKTISYISTILFVLYVFVIVKTVMAPMVAEKQSGAKEFIRIVSKFSYMNNIMRYLVHVVVGLIIYGASLTVAGSYGGLTKHMDTVCLVVLVVLFVMSFVAYTFMVSVLFNSVFLTQTGGLLCYALPALVMLSERTKCLAVVYDGLMLYEAFQLFDSYGDRGQVFKMSDVLESPNNGGHTMLFIYAMLLLHTIVYLLVYFYFVQVFPGPYGTPKPFYFPFQPSFYGRNETTSNDEFQNGNGSSEPLNDEVVVRLRGVCKQFRPFCGKSPNMAVKNVSMDIYRNQITVLLGHSGAGKTTTISLISGIISKTSGTIAVDGDENIQRYRHKIGYCPQHNVFIPYLTCLEHLLFFGGIRGMLPELTHQKSTVLLSKLKLTDNANEVGKNLSDGLKRRLCLGITLMGDTQIAIMDEPSAGLDPESKRELWNILLDMRNDNSMLITTHDMDEAEILADRISIMSDGEVMCSGTSVQLKRQYTNGYILKLLTMPSFNVSQGLQLIQSYVPAATIKSFVLPLLSITLPYKDIEHFPSMLQMLEKNTERIGIASISVSNASLDEVFLNSYDHSDKLPETAQNYVDDKNQSDRGTCIEHNKNIALRQFMAIFYKKFIFLREYWYLLLISLAVPVVAIIGSFLLINGHMQKFDSTQANTWPAMPLSFSEIEQPVVLLRTGMKRTNVTDAFEWALKNILLQENASLRYLSTGNYTGDELLDIERTNVKEYHEHIVCALDIHGVNDQVYVRTWFPGNSLHGTAIALNLVNNVILQMRTNGQYKIYATNKPLKVMQTTITGEDFDVYRAFISTSIFVYILFYVFLPFAEESTEFKKLQSVSPVLYWIAYYSFDIIVHTLFCGLLFALHFLCDVHSFFSLKEYTLLSTIPLFYGLFYLPLIYFVCQLFSRLPSLYTFIVYMYFISITAASYIHQEDVIINGTWTLVSMIFPDYALQHAYSAFAYIYRLRSLVQQGTDGNIESSSYVIFWRYYTFMALFAILAMAFLVVVWENIYRKQKLIDWVFAYKRCWRSIRTSCEQPTSEDVRMENELTDSVVRENNYENYAIVASSVHKHYSNLRAVRGISLTVKKGECVGLLGMNGAGKTTTLKMMTRDVSITQGEIYFNGVNSTKDPSQYKSMFGYCPQKDALIGYMTGYETIKYMAMIRGTATDRIEDSITKLLLATDLVRYADVPVKYYAGGTKRKLNTALAIQSDQSLVILDEPTTGVDPVSQRIIWACIQKCQKQNKTIVLTSHSMDDCEQLCNRLAIMKSGQLKYIGSIQKLKDTFVIVVILNRNRDGNDGRSSAVMSSMLSSFQCNLREEYRNQLRYIVHEQNLKWSEVFMRIQSIQQQNDGIIEEISVYESSLEDLFLKIDRRSELPTNSLSVEASCV